MKVLIWLVMLYFIQPVSLQAQSKQKAEKEFLAELNNILYKSRKQHSLYEGIMTVDSAFAINKEGILSVTLRYTNDSSYKRVRLQAPVKDISLVRYDLYLILEYTDKLVTYFESQWGS